MSTNVKIVSKKCAGRFSIVKFNNNFGREILARFLFSHARVTYAREKQHFETAISDSNYTRP